MLKEVNQLVDVLKVIAALQTLDADGDGIADLKEHQANLAKAAPYIASLTGHVGAAQKDIAEIQKAMGDSFPLLMKDIEVVKERLGIAQEER